MAITYCAQHETDGVVDVEFVEDVLPDQAERELAVSTLLDLGLWEGGAADDEFVVHDYLEFNDSREALRERRRRDAERKARGRANRVGPESEQAPDGFQSESEDGPPGPPSASARRPEGFQSDSAQIPASRPDGIHAASARPDPTRPDQRKQPPQPPAASRQGETSGARMAGGRKGSPRANGTNPRAVDRRTALEAFMSRRGDPPDATARDAWQRVRERLQRSVTDDVWEIWLEGIDLAGQDGETLLLSVDPDNLARVRERFTTMIETCARAGLGRSTPVELVPRGVALVPTDAAA